MSFFTVGSSNLRPINRLQDAVSNGVVRPQSRAVLKENGLDVKDGVSWIHSGLVLCGLTDETLLIGKRDEGRCGEATLLVGDCRHASAVFQSSATGLDRQSFASREARTDFNIGTLVVGNAGVCCAWIKVSFYNCMSGAAVRAYQDRCQWHRRRFRRPC